MLLVYDDELYWLIPAVLLFNVLFFWLLLNQVVLKSLLFLFAQKCFVNRELRPLNAHYCKQSTADLKVVKAAIREHIAKTDYTSVGNPLYENASDAFERLLDLFERFIGPNE